MSLHPFSDEKNFLCSERKFRAMYKCTLYSWLCCRLIEFEKYMHDSAADLSIFSSQCVSVTGNEGPIFRTFLLQKNEANLWGLIKRGNEGTQT